MKVLMQNRRDHFNQSGGDVIQIEKTKKYLEEIFNVEVDISTSFNLDLSEYDIVHLFNITRVHETIEFMKNAQLQGKPVVITPIFHDLEAIYKYEKYGRRGVGKYINKIVKNQTCREFIKNMIKALISKDFNQIIPVFKQLLYGYEKQQKFVIENSDYIFPIAKSEIDNIIRQLKVDKKLNYLITPNGLDINVERSSLNSEKIFDKYDLSKRKYVISVGRIEPRKNQLNLIKALEETEIGVIFVGAKNEKHKKYCSEFLDKIDNDKFIYLGRVNHDTMMSLYNKVELSVLPSWFEVTSLVDLEAYLSGLKIVTTKYSYINDFLGDNVSYCSPEEINSIRDCIIYQLNKGELNKANIKEDIEKYTWENTAKLVYDGYKEVLNNCKKE